ncbi:MAG: hypothetical protein MHM6MM_003946 [Cercozoa sp. M6MM]
MSVILFYSSIAGNLKIKSDTANIERLLEIKNIPFEKVDCAQDCNKPRRLQMREIAGTPALPQVHVVPSDGEQRYIGGWLDLADANEGGLLEQLLGVQQA